MQILRLCRNVLLAYMVLACLAVSAGAQNIFGSLIGSVTDSGDAVLPNASVTVTNLGTGEKRTAVTDGQGDYQVLSLPRGEYKVEIDAQGFKHFSRSPIDVVVDQEARVNVHMVIGEQSQQVVVNAAPPIMQTDSASLGQAVEGKAMETLPLNGRNVLALWPWFRASCRRAAPTATSAARMCSQPATTRSTAATPTRVRCWSMAHR